MKYDLSFLDHHQRGTAISRITRWIEPTRELTHALSSSSVASAPLRKVRKATGDSPQRADSNPNIPSSDVQPTAVIFPKSRRIRGLMAVIPGHQCARMAGDLAFFASGQHVSCSSCNKSIIPSAICWSRFPVGSSANSNLGEPASARAIAPRCC